MMRVHNMNTARLEPTSGSKPVLPHTHRHPFCITPMGPPGSKHWGYAKWRPQIAKAQNFTQEITCNSGILHPVFNPCVPQQIIKKGLYPQQLLTSKNIRLAMVLLKLHQFWQDTVRYKKNPRNFCGSIPAALMYRSNKKRSTLILFFGHFLLPSASKSAR